MTVVLGRVKVSKRCLDVIQPRKQLKELVVELTRTSSKVGKLQHMIVVALVTLILFNLFGASVL